MQSHNNLFRSEARNRNNRIYDFDESSGSECIDIFDTFFDQSIQQPRPLSLPHPMSMHTKSYIFKQESSDNCSLLIHAQLISEEEAYALATDQRIKIGLLTYLLLSEKISLEEAKTIGHQTMHSLKAKQHLAGLTEDHVLSFKEHNSPLLCVKYLHRSKLLEILPKKAAQSISNDYMLSLSNKNWLSILKEATILSTHLVSIIELTSPSMPVQTAPSSTHSPLQPTVKMSCCSQLFYMFSCCLPSFSQDNTPSSTKVAASAEEEEQPDLAVNTHSPAPPESVQRITPG